MYPGRFVGTYRSAVGGWGWGGVLNYSCVCMGLRAQYWNETESAVRGRAVQGCSPREGLALLYNADFSLVEPYGISRIACCVYYYI